MTRLLSVPEAAELLNVAQITIYKWVSKKKIPFVKIGSATRFRQEELEAWIESHCVHAGGSK